MDTMLFRIDKCNRDSIALKKQKEERGETLTPEEQQVYMIGADVIELFPSMTSVRTGRIVREKAIQSPIQYDGMNYREMARYAAIIEKHTSGGGGGEEITAQEE